MKQDLSDAEGLHDTQTSDTLHSSESIITKFEAYLLTQKRVAHHTFYGYRQDIRQYLVFLEKEHTPLAHAKREHVGLFLKELKTRGLAPRSIARKISSLKVLYGYLHEYFQWEPIMLDVSFPKLKKQLPRYLSEKEIQELFDSAARENSFFGRRNYLMLLMLYVTGIRVSELITLKVENILFDTHFIVITGKGDKQRMVPVAAEIITLIKQYLEEVHSTFGAKTVTKNRSEFLFPSGYAGSLAPMTRQAFWGILKNICAQTSIQRSISPHQVRHSLATHLLKKGADLRSLQLLLGHQQISTVQIYTHVDTTHLRSMYDKKHPRSS